MNNRDYIASIISKFSGQNNVIPIPVVYLEITEDYPAAALLNQMIYWSDRTRRKDGFFYKSYQEWHEELFLSEYQVRRATNKLKALGLVETSLKKANGAPTLHYKVDTQEVSEWILKKLKNGNLRNSRMDTEETQESLTEITTENTTKITNNSATKVTQEQFEQWWNLYDKKLDKKKAFSLFKSALKKHDFEKIMNGTKDYLKTITDKQFQKYPKTFLSQESFLNDYGDEVKTSEESYLDKLMEEG
ncbi:DnaD domain protein [Staphylococcus gallinarum]|uniref:DnaD domain protein n=1 Tax=Staphylococcus gallinarum TaxID=1293 RepID=UPI0030C13453